MIAMYNSQMAELKDLSRRRLLKVSASTLMAASIWPGALWADEIIGENFN